MTVGGLIPFSAAGDRKECGGKGANLSFLVGLGLRVPDGRVISAEEFVRHVEACRSGAAATLAAEIAKRPLSPSLSAELRTLIAELGGRVSVRSSATLEDAKTHSFAGQFLTVLNVGPAEIEDAVRRVWASAFSSNVEAYLRRAELEPSRLEMAVVVQRQIDSRSSGVAMGDRGRVAVEAVLGQGEALVSGEAQADHWEVAEGRIARAEIVNKPARRVLPPWAADGRADSRGGTGARSPTTRAVGRRGD